LYNKIVFKNYKNTKIHFENTIDMGDPYIFFEKTF